jgi:hypothetical protein
LSEQKIQKIAAVERQVECPVSELRPYSTQVYQLYHEAAHGVTLEDVQRPGYWRNLWRQLARARWTEIVVIAQDGTWEAVLRVTSAGEGFAKTRVLQCWEADKKRGRPPALPEGFSVDFVTGGWRVVNRRMNEVITTGHVTEEEAIEVARRLMAKMGAA